MGGVPRPRPVFYTGGGGAPLPLAAIAALRPRASARRRRRGSLAASLAAHAAAAALIVWSARRAVPTPAPPPLATFEMVVVPHATGTGTRPVGTAAVRRPAAAPRPAPAAPIRPVLVRPDPVRPVPIRSLPSPAPSRPPAAPPSPATVALAIPAPASPPAEINLGALELPGLGAVEGHGIVPPGPDATWHNQPPDFPREAQLRGEHGTVVVLIHVAPDGRASGADMVESSGWPILDRAVLEAVRMWRFRPGQRDGVPVASELPFRVVFSRGRRMMVRIDRVVTRGGDGGETSLGDGSRVRKDAARIEAIGAVDEANSAIGLLRLHSSRRD